MSSSLKQSPLRKVNQDEHYSAAPSLPSIEKAKLPNLKEETTPLEIPKREESIKNPLEHLLDSTKNFLWNLPKVVEASFYLLAAAVVTLILSPIITIFNGKEFSKNRTDILERVVSWGRKNFNQYLYCGSLLGDDREFAYLADGEIKDRLNPLKHLGESLMTSLVYAVDYFRIRTTRAIYNFSNNTNCSLEEFREIEHRDSFLRAVKLGFDLAKASASLIVLKKLGPVGMQSWQPLIISGTMSVSNAIGAKWQEGESALSVDTAERTVEGISNSLFFMGFMRGLSKGYVSLGKNQFAKELRAIKAQSVLEKYDLRDSLPDLATALHKARHDLLDHDTNKPRDNWAVAGHLLSVGSALTDSAELKLLDHLATINNQDVDSLDDRKFVKGKKSKIENVIVESETAVLEKALELLRVCGEESKGEITKQVLVLAYDVLQKTAEYWTKNGVQFSVAVRNVKDSTAIILNLDPFVALERMKILFGENGYMENIPHFPYLVVVPALAEGNKQVDSLNFIARKLENKSAGVQKYPWFMFFSPLQISPFHYGEAFFSFQHGVALGVEEVINLKKSSTFPHEYIHAYFETIQSDARLYPRISPIYDARIIDLKSSDRVENKILLEECVTYFSDFCRQIENYFKGDLKNTEQERHSLLNAYHYTEGFMPVLEKMIEKLLKKDYQGLYTTILNTNAVAITTVLEDGKIAIFTVSPGALANDLQLLLPTFMQRVGFGLKLFFKWCLGTKGTKLLGYYPFNFNNNYRNKALESLAIKLQYTKDFVQAFDVALHSLCNLIDILGNTAIVSMTERAKIILAIRKSIGTMRTAIGNYILWEVPAQYVPDKVLEDVAHNLPMYQFVTTDLHMKKGLEIFSNPAKTTQEKIDFAFGGLENALCYSRQELFDQYKAAFADFFNALTNLEKQELSHTRRFRKINKLLKIIN